MSNVLPPNEKKRLLQRVHARFVLLSALVLFAGAVVAMLALLPAFISMRLAQASIQSAQSDATGTLREDQDKATRAKITMDALKPFTSASSSPSEVIAGALAEKPKDIRITTITYAREQIVLSGISANREAVNAFRGLLENDANFTEVTVPVAALVGAQEGRFSVTLNGAF